VLLPLLFADVCRLWRLFGWRSQLPMMPMTRFRSSLRLSASARCSDDDLLPMTGFRSSIDRSSSSVRCFSLLSLALLMPPPMLLLLLLLAIVLLWLIMVTVVKSKDR
jgi:hypothetical protein